jgi:hypothetical protein
LFDSAAEMPSVRRYLRREANIVPQISNRVNLWHSNPHFVLPTDANCGQKERLGSIRSLLSKCSKNARKSSCKFTEEIYQLDARHLARNSAAPPTVAASRSGGKPSFEFGNRVILRSGPLPDEHSHVEVEITHLLTGAGVNPGDQADPDGLIH